MSLQDYKINQYQTSIQSLPDKIENKAQWLKEQFDARTDNEVKASVNGIIEEISADTASGQIGCTVPDGVTAEPNVQSVLNGLKTTIDNAVIEAGAGDMQKAVYDTDNDGKVDIAQLADVATVAENGVFTYTQAEGVLTGNGMYGSFKATDSGVYSEFSIDDTSFDVVLGEETEIELIENKWYQFIVDTENSTINFKGGSAGGGNIPDGETVLPVNDVEIWLNCAGVIYAEQTLAEILADENLCDFLANSTNAMNYLIRSTEIQTSALESEVFITSLDSSLPFNNPSMTSATAPYGTVTYLGYNYSTYKAYWQSSDGDNANGAYGAGDAGDWVAYNFREQDYGKWIYKFSMRSVYGLAPVKLQGQIADGTWVDLSEVFNPYDYDALTTVVCIPNTYKVKAVRFIKTTDDTGPIINSGKVWGK